MITAKRKNRSALSLALELRTKMRNAEGRDWDEEDRFLTDITQIFSSEAAPTGPELSRTVVSTSVVDRWAAMLQDGSQHDLTIQAADGECTVHASILRRASKVVEALLQAPMQETTSKRISLECPEAAVRFFLELVYVGGISDDVSADTALHALDLAHRWQVDDVVLMLERYVSGLITVETFEEIATSAQILSLPSLKRACTKFAERPDIQQKIGSGAFNKNVMMLVGRKTFGEAIVPKKRRRMF